MQTWFRCSCVTKGLPQHEWPLHTWSLLCDLQVTWLLVKEHPRSHFLASACGERLVNPVIFRNFLLFVSYLFPQPYELLHSLLLVKRKSMHNKCIKKKKTKLADQGLLNARGEDTCFPALSTWEWLPKLTWRQRELNPQNCPLVSICVPQHPPEAHKCTMHR